MQTFFTYDIQAPLKALQMSPDVKYKKILYHERSWAESVARSLKKKKPISVWEVMLPVLLIFNYARSMVDQDLFARNLVFTKELALKAALEMARDGRSKAEVILGIEEKTRELLTSVKGDVYSETIRQRQMIEMDLLIDHYLKLIQADGRDVHSLVQSAYQRREDYLIFLDKLKNAEHDVNLSALETLGAKGDPAFVSRMEEAAESVRLAMARRIFTDDG